MKTIGVIRICEICDKYAADDSGMCKKCWRAGRRPQPIATYPVTFAIKGFSEGELSPYFDDDILIDD